MALQAVDPPAAPSAQVVANAFVEQYYHILHHSPELVYRFYQDSSVLSRQEKNGEMTSVTTMQGINAKILSLDYKSYKAEINTADAQESYKDGVMVLVTGCLTGKDNLRKKFAQSFFLAPQAKGYFVLNDVFRYIDDSEPLDANTLTVEMVDDSQFAQVAADTETLHTHDSPGKDMTTAIKNQTHTETTFQTAEQETQVGTKGEEVLAGSQSIENHISETSQSSSCEDGAKNSYASIVKNNKGIPGPTKIYVPTTAVRLSTANSHKQSSSSMDPASVPEPSVPTSKAVESVNAHEEVEGHSIYVRNLPMNVMVTQLEQEFRRFGQIKQGGVQVRSNRQQGSCYGFVEFLSARSMESAIQASPIVLGGRQAFVEVKRSTTRVDGARGGRFPSSRGGFRTEHFRVRGGYGRCGFIRNELGGRGEFSGWGRTGLAGRSGDGYHLVRGRAGRHQSAMNRNTGAS